MVRQGFWVAGLLCFAISWSGETGSLSARAHQMYQNGRYPQAVHLLQRALAASAKDADLEAESRIYMDLAQIFIEEMEYDAAADALGQIPTNKISTASRLFSLRLRLQLLNQQEKYAEAWNVYNAEAQTISQAGASVLRGLLYLEAAEAAAGIAANVSVQSKLLKRAERDLDDETPGPLAMAKARVADLSGHPDTALYQNALHLA
ncbi:MAG TPA: hypothetical protein VLM37_08355, partial [Fibrobacteraceae bacterium]|nr:hypothetical protein [Fibrobacteraceae bacterium]